MGYVKGSSCSALCRGCWGPRREPEPQGAGLSPSGAFTGKGHRPSGAPHGTQAAFLSGAGLSPGSSWRKARLWPALSSSSLWPLLLFLGLSEAPTHFSVTSSGQKAPALSPTAALGPVLAP